MDTIIHRVFIWPLSAVRFDCFTTGLMHNGKRMIIWKGQCRRWTGKLGTIPVAFNTDFSGFLNRAFPERQAWKTRSNHIGICQNKQRGAQKHNWHQGSCNSPRALLYFRRYQLRE
jgi:hypothetical protein